MTWLSENWLLLLLMGGVAWFVIRGGGIGCGMGGHAMRHGSQPGSRDNAMPNPGPPNDPVSNEPVPNEDAITTVYRGRVYRFATRENRDRFEAAPEQYAKATEGKGMPRRHGGHGCC